jgi:hypothetical protein
MRTLLVSALALGAWTSAALAEPVALTDVQMDSLTAGQITQSNSSTVEVSQTNSANDSTVSGSISQTNSSTVTVTQSNSADGATVSGGGGGG